MHVVADSGTGGEFLAVIVVVAIDPPAEPTLTAFAALGAEDAE